MLFKQCALHILLKLSVGGRWQQAPFEIISTSIVFPIMQLPGRLSWLCVLPALVMAQEQGECPLTCLHGTSCIRDSINLGGVPYDALTGEHFFHNQTDSSGWICDCPPGLTGMRCGREFQSCGVEQEKGKGTAGCL